MPRPALPEPDPDTLVARLPDGTLVLVARLDPDRTADTSPLRRALQQIRQQTPGRD
ncbi:hypothetical protein [Streptomyces sp. NPDC047981]|uniref:hypothetical protein n=1 Tax=Streptomyces sp. NPDC047981 TaxID=3154610 RepID=UPI003417120F